MLECIYDFATNKVKIIDFEMTVKLPNTTTNTIREKLSTRLSTKITEEDCNAIATVFARDVKDMAVSLLSLSKDICYVNADADELIYNNDECFLPMLITRV
jgi:hypothetical protein